MYFPTHLVFMDHGCLFPICFWLLHIKQTNESSYDESHWNNIHVCVTVSRLCGCKENHVIFMLLLSSKWFWTVNGVQIKENWTAWVFEIHKCYWYWHSVNIYQFYNTCRWNQTKYILVDVTSHMHAEVSLCCIALCTSWICSFSLLRPCTHLRCVTKSVQC